MEDHTDTEYLKQYVRLHPDNRMAWYLLGKAYMQQGKPGKANDCFLQAGDIYEAYERKRHPLAEAAPRETLERWNRDRQRRRLAKRIAMLAVLLFGLTVTIPAEHDLPPGAGQPAADTAKPNPAGQTDSAERPADEGKPHDPQPGGAERPGDSGLPHHPAPDRVLPDVETIDGIRAAAVVRVIDPAAASPIGDALEALLDSAARASAGLAVRLEEDRGWRIWRSAADGLLLGIERGPSSASALVRMYDADSCVCVPDDVSDAARLLDEWMEQREQWWVLRSAIRRFAELHGAWPASIGDLARPYPNNILAGETAVMRGLFPHALAAERRLEAAGTEGGADADGVSAWNAGVPDGTPGEPLEIIIDKSNYRLALVSGGVILRSYEVGLGGERTPEGTFIITEKVKNPNGREDGEFGSRGMTLSDTDYAIHGTNDPGSIGRDESLGCIRMLKEDVEELYDMVPLGTRVTITADVLPGRTFVPEKRFRLEPTQDETNPGKVYRWL